MSFYLRKSISAGPFRFNLSGSGLGMSVGVKGFRVGSGPRGNYVHMGRGGIYYRASLGRAKNPKRSITQQHSTPSPISADTAVSIETGDVADMSPSSGSQLLAQINEKMALWRIWPFALASGFALTAIISGNGGDHDLVAPLMFITFAATWLAWWWDKSRRAIVVMYDLSDEFASAFQTFSDAFDQTGRASRIWNIDTAARTTDWKRNAGAGRLVGRHLASFVDAAPAVLKTNVRVPCISGGKHNIHFLPDCVLVVEGSKAGAVDYDQLNIFWNTTVFIEDDGIPHDSQIVGHTWRFVNKNGGPDRRFNNNKQIPQVRYQQMGMQGSGGFQKILHLSKVEDRSGFDMALAGVRSQITAISKNKPDAAPQPLLSYEGSFEEGGGITNPKLISALALVMAIAALLYFVGGTNGAFRQTSEPQQLAPAPIQPVARPTSSEQHSMKSGLQKNEARKYGYRAAGNLGNFESPAAGTVTEFFRDLERGDGVAASNFVVPLKRETGPLSAPILTAKFSGLQEPLHLDNVEIFRAGRIIARYSYMPPSGMKCVGVAHVTVVRHEDENLISTIRSQESCH